MYQGFTIVELLVSLAIIGIVAGFAVQSMSGSYSSNKVSGLAERIQTDLVWARTQAILKSKPVTMKFSATSTWCYGFEYNDGNPSTSVCDCGTPSTCLIEGVPKTNSYSSYSNTTLATTLNSTSITFNSRGLANGTNRTITLSDGSSSVLLRFNPLGRGDLCSNELVQYKTCM